MCKVAMEIDDAETAHRLFRRFESATSYLANIVSYTKCMWRPTGRFSFGAIAARVVRGVDEVIYDAIRERKRQGARGESPLDALIRGQDQHAYNDAFIRDNIVALLAAGYETTGAAITWMLYWADRTDSYSVLQAKRTAGDTEYLTAFRNECLRYCPPVEILPRRVAEDRAEKAAEILPDLAPYAKQGTPPMVCPFVHRVHHDESVHANPREFSPERFIGRSYGPTEFFPFGLGRRFCLGAVLGQRLMDLVLNRLLARSLRLDFLSKTFSPVRRNVVIWPGVFMVARCSRK
jgi:cytochrome P450